MSRPWRVCALVLIGVAACGAPQKPAPPPHPCSVCPPPELPKQPALLDGETLKANSKALFAALDNNDIPAFEGMVGPSFVLFDQARSYTVPMIVQRMRGDVERSAPKRNRTWKEERVFLGPNTAVFIGDAVESVPAHDGKTTEWEGWNTLVWVHDGTDWKIAHGQWQPGGLEAERAMWNEAYRKSSISFKTTPNQLLVDTVKDVKKKGAALDIAMGQGRNAVFLATKGWKVTGVDISDEGIRIAKEAATKARVKIDAVQADIDRYEFGTEKWDLVTLIYAGSDETLIDKIKPAIRKNGLFVVEFFNNESTTGSGIGGFRAGQLAAVFEGWKIIKDEVVEDLADWGMRRVKLVRFVAQKL